MDAMILAAGLGTRLRPLTNEIPKALVPVADVPMLERVAHRAVEAGADRLIINVHWEAGQIKRFVDEHDGFGADEVRISHEVEDRLETGGGILFAEPHFRKDAPFLVHNADIVTDIDLRALYASHDDDRLATLACRPVETDRYLVFDDAGLAGYAYGGEEKLVRELQGEPQRLDFCGVMVLSPRIFELFEESGKFSIMNTFLRLTKTGERILPHRVDDALWIDIGTHERLAEANAALAPSAG